MNETIETIHLLNYTQKLFDKYQDWLLSQNDGHRLQARFEDRLGNPEHQEAAIFEALVWRYLQTQSFIVNIGESLGNGGPDFICLAGVTRFIVEATCIKINHINNMSKKLEPEGNIQLSEIPLLSDLVCKKVNVKIQQIRKWREKQKIDNSISCVLAIGSFHPLFSSYDQFDLEMCLTGRPCGYFGDNDAFIMATADKAAFMREKEDRLDRGVTKEISAVFIINGNNSSPEAMGIINDDALVPFNPSIVPNIAFKKLLFEQNHRACRVI